MNVGKWIVLAFVLFAVFIGTLVTICVNQDISLVSKDYYKEELVYQEQIARITNTMSLKQQPKLTKGRQGQLMVSFGCVVGKGKLQLFCPSNKNMDRNFDIQGAGSHYSFAIDDLQRGMYRAKIYWQSGEKEFYYEEAIYI